MHLYVYSSFSFNADYESDKKRWFISPSRFFFDTDSKHKESFYEVYFIDKKVIEDKEVITTYNYGFTVDSKGVVEEWLNTKAKTAKEFKTVFYRDKIEKKLNLSGIPKKQQENIKISLNRETLILSLGAILKVTILEKVYNWFLNNPIVPNRLLDDSIYPRITENILPWGFADDKNVRKEVLKCLSTFDTDIIDFEVYPSHKDEKGNDTFFVQTIHKSINSEDLFSHPLLNESSGTLKMFFLYQYIRRALRSGGVLFIDELNTSLHPVMLSNIIKTFTNKKTNPNGSQLIFTTHDVIQLDTGSLRRDEIWFTEKVNGQSQLYSLADFIDEDGKKIRKDEDYQRNYLVGKYGAIPNLEDIGLVQEE